MNVSSDLIVGYATGVFDLFHIGHLKLLQRAKGLCDRLIVGVTVDELLWDYKRKHAVIPFEERCEIVRSIRCVDLVVPQYDMDKFLAWEKLKFDILFVGDDWYNTEKWQDIEERLARVGVRVVYFPYTRGTSSTMLNEMLQAKRREMLPPSLRHATPGAENEDIAEPAGPAARQ